MVMETGQLSSESLAKEVCLHPGAFHEDFLIVEYLQDSLFSNVSFMNTLKKINFYKQSR